jgi:hypothetical protein
MVPDTERKWIAHEMRHAPVEPGRFLLLLAAAVVLLMFLWKAC